MTIEEALQVLELKWDCSFTDAKKAYKDLIQVWHSDRYTHNAKLLERAHQKTQRLNEAWALISKIGEKDFSHHLAKKKPSAQKSQASTDRPSGKSTSTTDSHAPRQDVKRSEIKLKEFEPTGVMMVPIWQNSTRRIPHRLAKIFAVILFLAGAIQFRAIEASTRLMISGESYDGVVELCGERGKESQIGFAGISLVKDIPERYLSIAMKKSGQITYTCPERIGVTYVRSDPNRSVIGRPTSALLSVALPLLLYLVIPALIFRATRKS